MSEHDDEWRGAVDQLAEVESPELMTNEVWILIDYCRARYARTGDAIMILMQAAALIAANSFVQGDTSKTNRETLASILEEAVRQAERVNGVQ